MDDEFQNLEAELKRLWPVSPSRALHDRVGRELGRAAVRHPATSVRLIWWVALPAAAAVAVALLQFSAPAPARKSTDEVAAAGHRERAAATAPLKPISAENVLVSASDEGLVTLDDGTPARRERLHFVDTITWRDPRTNSSLRWSVPREEVRIVPVAFQ